MRRLVLLAALGSALAAVTGADGASFDQIDVSNLRGSQAEVAIAADPTNPSVLLAASNSVDFRSLALLGNLMRTYSSADGGATWAVGLGPAATPYHGVKRCNGGDPVPAIDAGGRQYVAFLAVRCVTIESILLGASKEFDVARLEVATRPDAASPWQVSQVFPVRSARFDDKPALAADNDPASPHAGRIYVAWTRITPGARRGALSLLIAVSHSDDHGTTWSKPVIVPDRRGETTFAGIAIDSAGTVFVSWADTDHHLFLDRSVDGGETFGADVAIKTGLNASPCNQPGSFSVPAQAERCLTPTPTVAVDSRPGVAERVYLTYSAPDRAGRAQDVAVRVYDQNLAPVAGERTVHPPDSGRDEFMPASAIDDHGRLWVCYYDTGADRTRLTAQYTCTASADGAATFAAPRAVATVASDETKRPAIGFQYGDYQGLAVAGGIAHPIWTDGRDLGSRGEEIYTSTLTAADLQLP